MRVGKIGLVSATIMMLTFASCGSPAKMMTTGKDMATTPSDMVMALNCLGYGGCVLDCLNQAGATGDPTACITACQGVTKMASLIYWSDAYQCGDDYCNGVGDASIAKCVSPAGATTEMDAPGQPQGACVDCLLEARDPVLGDFSDPNLPTAPTGMCPNPKSPDCQGGPECMPKFQKCINDM